MMSDMPQFSCEDMPPVARCEVEKCFYNRDRSCHAPAITIGSSCPDCETFMPKSDHIRRQATAGVGACHVMECRFNEEMICHAKSINVGYQQDHVECMTFSER